MSDFIVIRNLKAPRHDVSITDDIIEEDTDYSLMVDVSLYEERKKKGTGEDGDSTFVFIPTGPIRLLNMRRINERHPEADRDEDTP